MKWFKHETDAIISEKLAWLISVHGWAGYGRWWRLLEIVAEKMDKTDRHHVELPKAKWAELLGYQRHDYMMSWLSAVAQMKLCSFTADDQMLRIEIPNLLKKRDEYSKRSGHNREFVPTPLISVSVSNPNPNPIPRAKKESIPNELKKELISKNGILSFPDFWSWYPVHVGEKECKKKFAALKQIDLEQIHAVMQIQDFIKITFGQYVFNPLKFLNGEHWKDQPRKRQSEDNLSGVREWLEKK